MCADLVSAELGLFVPCANAAAGLGDNRDRFVPRPSATAPADLAAFYFAGQLLGVAVLAPPPPPPPPPRLKSCGRAE